MRIRRETQISDEQPRSSASREQPTTEATSPAPDRGGLAFQPTTLLALQRQVGNDVVVQLLRSTARGEPVPVSTVAGATPVVQRGRNGGTATKGGSTTKAGKKQTGPPPAKKKTAEQVKREEEAAAAKKLVDVSAKAAAINTAVEAAEGEAALADSEVSLTVAQRLLGELRTLGPKKSEINTAEARIARALKAVENKRTAKSEAALAEAAATAVIKMEARVAPGVENSARRAESASAFEDAAIAATEISVAELAESQARGVLNDAEAKSLLLTATINKVSDRVTVAKDHHAKSSAAIRYAENEHLGPLITTATEALAAARQTEKLFQEAVQLTRTYVDGATAAVARKRADKVRQEAAELKKAAATQLADADATAAKEATKRLREAQEARSEANSAFDALQKQLDEVEARYQAAEAEAAKSSAYAKLVTGAAEGEMGAASDSASEFVDAALDDVSETRAAADALAGERSALVEPHQAAQKSLGQATGLVETTQKEADSTKATAANSKALLNEATRQLAQANGAITNGAKALNALKARREKDRVAVAAAAASGGAPVAAESEGLGDFFRPQEILKLAPTDGPDLMAHVGAGLLEELELLLQQPILPADMKHVLPLLKECPKTKEGVDGVRELVALAGNSPEYLNLVVKHGTFAKLAKLKQLLALAGVTSKDLAFYLDPDKGGQNPDGLHTDLAAGYRVWKGGDTAEPAYLPAGTTLATIIGDAAPCLGGADPGTTYAGNRPFRNLGGPGDMRLPTTQSYTEYDIKPWVAGGRGPERVVVDGRGWKYYTGDHYATLLRYAPTPAIAP